MGFTYRKSISLGPFRVNLSKSGVGYSVGGKGFRTGVGANGKRYTTFNIPGTGIGYKVDKNTVESAKGCLGMVVGLIGLSGLLGAGVWLLILAFAS